LPLSFHIYIRLGGAGDASITTNPTVTTDGPLRFVDYILFYSLERVVSNVN